MLGGFFKCLGILGGSRNQKGNIKTCSSPLIQVLRYLSCMFRRFLRCFPDDMQRGWAGGHEYDWQHLDLPLSSGRLFVVSIGGIERRQRNLIFFTDYLSCTILFLKLLFIKITDCSFKRFLLMKSWVKVVLFFFTLTSWFSPQSWIVLRHPLLVETVEYKTRISILLTLPSSLCHTSTELKPSIRAALAQGAQTLC